MCTKWALWAATPASANCGRQGHSLAAICRRKNLPAPSTVYKWLAESPEFSERYAHAREQQADFYADEIIEIADNCPPETGEVAKAKLKIDARKWKAARLAPKKYSEKTELDLKSTDGSMPPDKDNPRHHRPQGNP
ncbi:hypothetical protein [Eikenella sp. Marseille-P7795]|uniref:terminase small subunit-like protein n=1 Tax=Eikenella sp. Marseille-P7795 TaxID=2866577 RepID=UPI00351D7CA5